MRIGGAAAENWQVRRGAVLVGLRGLEPLTSSLSGKRSNRLSYRPGRCTLALPAGWTEREGYRMLRSPHKTHQLPNQLSSASVTSMPPSRAAERL